MPKKRICFVIQAFGRKSDPATGRTLNLDASYEVIKQAAEESGFQCFRADEIVYSMVESHVYEWLYSAELVIADLSTSSLNAIYQLGVRFALRRRSTIVVAEDQHRGAFDLMHVHTLLYHHLGESIEPSEALRFKDALKQRIVAGSNDPGLESPVYSYLALRPPLSAQPMRDPHLAESPHLEPAPESAPQVEQSAKALLDSGRAAMNESSFVAAKMYFRALRGLRPNDEALVQELASATFRCGLPTPRAALEEARELLEQELNPRVSNNPFTLRLWSTVHRRLWELAGDLSHLSEAATTLERLYHVTFDYEIANDLAYVLNLRAEVSARDGSRHDAVADFVLARRMRRSVLERSEQQPGTLPPGVPQYWRLASLWEAAVGLEDAGRAAVWQKEVEKLNDRPWKLSVTQRRIDRLQQLIRASPLAARRTS
jgi:hypothetical protein